jgi:hypothetical protein
VRARAALGLALGLALRAQEADRPWSVDAHLFAPSIGGHLQGVTGGNAFNVDLNGDLGLSRDRSDPGFALEYQGPRFGLALSWDQQHYAGSNLLGRDITVNGRTFQAGTVVTSSGLAAATTLDGTFRALTWPGAWAGLDLGVRATTLKLDTSGTAGFPGVTAQASYRTTLPMPQAGPSAGFTLLDGRLAGRAWVHLLAYRGATYNRLGFDLRYFPLPWLGVRVFADSERIRVPNGTLREGLDFTLDRTGTGVGIVARF